MAVSAHTLARFPIAFFAISRKRLGITGSENFFYHYKPLFLFFQRKSKDFILNIQKIQLIFYWR